MTKLDQALAAGLQDRKMQPVFYDLFLNSLFFIPIVDGAEPTDSDKHKFKGEEEGALPLLVEADGKNYLLLFDTIKRLTDWADEDAKYVALPGHAVTEMSLPNLHWAMNYGTEQQKQFDPDEIAWLKSIVQQAKEDAAQQGQEEK